ncbi:MAG: hypothetical protein ABFS21_06430 [Actinomycetota bacterium]
MQSAHPTSEIRSTDGSAIHTGIGWMLGAVAVPMTLFFGWGVIDALTRDYVGVEAAIVWFIVEVAGFLATLAWVGAIALIKSGRDRSRRSRLVPIGLTTALLGALWTLVLAAGVAGGLPIALWPVTAAIAVIGLITALVGAIRM